MLRYRVKKKEQQRDVRYSTSEIRYAGKGAL